MLLHFGTISNVPPLTANPYREVNFLKKRTAILIALLFLIGCTFCVHALEASESTEASTVEASAAESSDPEPSTPESSASEESDASEFLPSEASEPSEPSETSDPTEPSTPESSTEPSTPEASEPSQSSEESSQQESYIPSVESSQSPSSSIPNPFSLIAGITPSMTTSDSSQSSAQEETSVEETTSIPEENTNIPTVDENYWLSSGTSAIAQDIPATDDSDILTGIILWSAIGMAITTILIILLNIKGHDRSSYSKNRYTSAPLQQRTSYSSRKYYK